MSDLFGNHIVGFPTRRLKLSLEHVGIMVVKFSVENVMDKSVLSSGKHVHKSIPP